MSLLGLALLFDFWSCMYLDGNQKFVFYFRSASSCQSFFSSSYPAPRRRWSIEPSLGSSSERTGLDFWWTTLRSIWCSRWNGRNWRTYRSPPSAATPNVNLYPLKNNEGCRSCWVRFFPILTVSKLYYIHHCRMSPDARREPCLVSSGNSHEVCSGLRQQKMSGNLQLSLTP